MVRRRRLIHPALILAILAGLLLSGTAHGDSLIPPPDEVDLDVFQLVREGPTALDDGIFNCEARVKITPQAGAKTEHIDFSFWAQTTCTQAATDDAWSTVHEIKDVKLYQYSTVKDSVPDVICPPSGSGGALPCSTTTTEIGEYVCDVPSGNNGTCGGTWYTRSRHEIFIGNWIAGSTWHIDSQNGKCTFEGQAPNYQTAHIICNLEAKYIQT